MRYQADSSDAGEMESSAYVELDRNPETNPAIFCDCSNLPSLTRQEFAAECDINNLMSQFEKTGILPTTNSATPNYLDVSDVPDLMLAHEILQNATTAFMSLPATVRRDFDNDPLKFVAFAEDPENLPKMREWKLAPPPVSEPAPQRVEIVNPPEPSKPPSA